MRFERFLCTLFLATFTTISAGAITVDFESPPVTGLLFAAPLEYYCAANVCFQYGARGSVANLTQSTAYFGGAGLCGTCQNNFVDIAFTVPVANVEFTLYNYTGQNQPDILYSKQACPRCLNLERQLSPSPSFFAAGSQVVHIADTGITYVRVSTGRGVGIDDFSYDLATSPPSFTFDLPASDQVRVLTRKTRPLDAYPSSLQTADHEIQVEGHLRNSNGTPVVGGTVFFRLHDPPDPSAYVVHAGDSAPGDNLGGPGALNGNATGVVSATSDIAGRVSIALATTDHVAGDNYQVEASPNSSFSCTAGCPRSATYTAWKRVYIESESMFRRGSFLNDVASAGQNLIPVEDPAPFQGIPIGSVLELVHAESGLGEGFYFDFVKFKSLFQNGAGSWVVEVDTQTGTSVPRDYGSPASAPSVNLDVTRDGVGVVSAGTFDGNDSDVAPLFGSMFVEFLPIMPTVTEVPFAPQLTLTQTLFYASRWLENGLALSPFTKSPKPNVFHRIIATQTPLVPVGMQFGAELGVTFVGGGSSQSFILQGRIENLVKGGVVSPTTGMQVGAEFLNLNTLKVMGETTAHETVHFWVHKGGSDGTGHCLRTRWQGGLNCLMHEPYAGPGLDDGIIDLHYESHGGDSELTEIRRAQDPVSQQ